MAEINGTPGSETLNGTEGDDVIKGLEGNDTIRGLGGNDSIDAGMGDDRIYGGAGNDTLLGGPKRGLPWNLGSGGDWDVAHYDDLGSPISLNLSTLQVTTSAGTDVVLGIEEVRGTGLSDTVSGSLALRDPSHPDLTTYLVWAGMGGSDSLSQQRVPYAFWNDALTAHYGWSNAAITATASGGNITVSYGASPTGKTRWNSNVDQAAGVDQLSLVSSFSDTEFSDVFNLANLTSNSYGADHKYNWVSISTGNDTVVGNGETALDINSRATSSSGKGINLSLPGAGTTVLDMAHMTWSGTAMGRLTLSGVRDIRATFLDDTLVGGGYDDLESFRGKGGNDSIDGGAGYDRSDYYTASTGVAVDLWRGIATGIDSTNSTIGTDTLRSIEAIRGTNLDDVYDASNFGKAAAPGEVTNVGSGVFGLAGGNAFEGRAGNDLIKGNGATRIEYQGSATGVDVDLLRGTAFAVGDLSSEAAKSIGLDTFSGVFRVRGSSWGDKLAGGGSGATYGNVSLEVFEPGPGNDTVDGRGGADEVVYTGRVWPSLRGMVIDMNISTGPQVTEDGYGGKDTLIGIESIIGSDFADHIKGSINNLGLFQLVEVIDGGKGNDTIDGGSQGYDEAQYGQSPAGIVINLLSGTASDGWGNTDTLISIEGIEGSPWNDVITGDAGNNRLDGRGGQDTIDGGAGTDWVEYNNASGAVSVHLGNGTANGAMGTDTLLNIENVQGSVHNDTLVGNAGNNVIEALDGNDTLAGGEGSDTLDAGLGDDRLYGGAGDDLLIGGPRRTLTWSVGTAGDWDQALYDDTSAAITLNLSTLQVSGSSAGTDTLQGIEEVRGTGLSDTVSGSLATRDANRSDAQGGLSWAGMGGSDTLSQQQMTYVYWNDGIYANYGWSNAAITVTASGGNVTVSYGASSTGKTLWNSNVAQGAGSDSLSLISSLGDSAFSDSFDLSGLTANHYGGGSKSNYVSVSTGNDTVTGNGDTVLNVSSGSRATSTTGKGINLTLAGDSAVVLNLMHLNWSGVAMGQVTLKGVDDIRATDFDDTLVGGGYNDYESFRGKGGNDSIDGGAGYDRADYQGSTTGVHVDLWRGIATGIDSTNASIGTDTLRSIEAVRGTNLDDVFDASNFGQAAPQGQTVNVGSGVFNLAHGNSFEGRAGNDIIKGNGATRIDYTNSAVGVDADLLRGTAFAMGDINSEAAKSLGQDAFSGVFRVRGTPLADKLSGGTNGRAYGSTQIEGFEPGAGNDTVDGRGGWDEVYYGFTSPTQGLVVDLNITTGPQVTNDGSGGQDTLIGIEAISGTSFADSIKGRDDHSGLAFATELFVGYKGNDTIDGRGGYDEVGYRDDPAGVTVNLTTGTATDGWGNTDTLLNIEGVEGGPWNDSITGSSADNRLDGAGGNDTLDGGAGIDWVEYNNASGAVSVHLGNGTANGAMGTDTLISIENVQGTIYADTLTGNTGNNVLEGLDGNDTLSGGDGADTLLGGEGNDRFYGQAGNDRLEGGPRRNLSWGTGTSGDYDTADYNSVTTNGITLSLSALTVTGNTQVGTDTLVGIEEVRATKLADTVTGTLAARNPNGADAQTGLSWIGLGGSDTLTQTAAPFAYWADSIFVDYAWSGTAVQATATAADKIAVSYGSAQAMYWYGGAQSAGTDQLTLISSIGDSRWADNIDLSQFSTGMTGSRRNYVGLTSGDDTVKGNADTTLSLLSSSSTTSSTGKGVSVTLPAAGQSASIDARHLSWQPLSSSTDRATGGSITISGIDEVRGTAFNDTLTGGAYDDYEAFRGRAGDDLIDGGSGYDMADYLGSTAGVEVLLAQGIARSTVAGDTSIGTDTLRGIEAIRGTNFNDIYDARGYGLSTAANVGGALNLADGNSFEGRGGNDQIIGNGTTRIDYQGAAVGVNVDLARGTAFALGDTNSEAAKSIGFDSFSGVFRVRGTTFGDQLTGGSAGYAFGSTLKEAFQPGAGNDTVDGKDGWDDVYYGDGGTTGVVIDMTITSGPQVTEDGFGGQDTLIGIEHISGGDFADSIKGSLNNAGLDGLSESFSGGKGNDTIDGGNQGYDEAVYGADPAGVTVNLALGTATDGWGNTDTLISIEGVEGSNFNDSIVGSSGDNRLDGRSGNDTLDGGAGNDWVEYNNATGGVGVTVDLGEGRASGSLGTDVLRNIENVQGTIYADSLSGDAGINILQGMAGDDAISDGPSGDDTLLGGDGNDNLYPSRGNDLIDGGNGIDTIYYQYCERGIVADLKLGTVSIDGLGGSDTVRNVENIHGSWTPNSGDSITLGDSGGYVFARAGNDTLIGGSGNDRFQAGSGNDQISGGLGTDTVVYRDDGYDTDSAPPTGKSVTVNLANGTATDQWGNTDFITGVENVEGSAHDDVLTGDGQSNQITGDSGNDTLNGGDGDDRLTGDAGNDSLNGGNGFDQAEYAGLMAGYSIDLNGAGGTVIVTDTDTSNGDEGTDTLSGIEQIRFADGSVSTAANSNFTGDDGPNLLTGTAGNNLMNGLGGNDTLLGLGGRDTLIGGEGNDSLDGGVVLDRYTNSDGNLASYAGSPDAVEVNLQTGGAADGWGGTDTLRNITNLTGSDFGDLLIGSSAVAQGEWFFGGKGDDTIDGGALSPTARGVEFNQVSYFEWNAPTAMTSGVAVDLQAGKAVSAYYGNDTLRNVQGVTGTRFNDTLLGADDNYIEIFWPAQGNDTIDGRGGSNNNVGYGELAAAIIGNLALGTVRKLPASAGGAEQIDVLLNIQGLRGTNHDDQLIGGNRSNDAFERFVGFKGKDTIDGGSGYDRVDYHTSPAAVTVQLGGEQDGMALDGYGTQDVLRNIEAASGSFYDDLLVGSDSAAFESFEGLHGNDTLDGRGGIDRLDLLRSPSGATVVLGLNQADGYALDGQLDFVSGLSSRDVLRGIENVRGTIFNDSITGNEQGNELQGREGNDTLSGGEGNDTLEGGLGNDSLNGGQGDDTAVFTGKRSEYSFSYSGGSGSITGAEGLDQLSSIEFLEFADQRVSLLADTTAPKVVSVSPTSGSVDVPVDANFVVRFDEPIKLGTGKLTLSYGGITQTLTANSPEVSIIGTDLIVNPAGDMPAGTTFTTSMDAGFVKDQAGNAALGQSGYTFTTSASEPEQPADVMVELRNLNLFNDPSSNFAEITFDLLLADDVYNGAPITGVLVDLDFDSALVSSSYVISSTYLRNNNPTNCWPYITSHLDGADATGKIAMGMAQRHPSNPLVDDSGSMVTVVLNLNRALADGENFSIGFAAGNTQVVTDAATSTVATGLAQTVQGYSAFNYVGEIETSLLGSKALPKVDFTRADGEDDFQSGSDGKASILATEPDAVTVTPSRPLSAAEQSSANKAVGLTDAISILKMIVGLNINTGNTPATAYQVIAADFNQNGNIGLDDAIGVLKHVVGLQAPTPSLKFVDAQEVPSALSLASYNSDTAKGSDWLSGKIAVPMNSALAQVVVEPVQVVGVLAGDVNGDWNPAASGTIVG